MDQGRPLDHCCQLMSRHKCLHTDTLTGIFTSPSQQRKDNTPDTGKQRGRNGIPCSNVARPELYTMALAQTHHILSTTSKTNGFLPQPQWPRDCSGDSKDPQYCTKPNQCLCKIQRILRCFAVLEQYCSMKIKAEREREK